MEQKTMKKMTTQRQPYEFNGSLARDVVLQQLHTSVQGEKGKR